MYKENLHTFFSQDAPILQLQQGAEEDVAVAEAAGAGEQKTCQVSAWMRFHHCRLGTHARQHGGAQESMLTLCLPGSCQLMRIGRGLRKILWSLHRQMSQPAKQLGLAAVCTHLTNSCWL